jgi:hypothetical protein
MMPVKLLTLITVIALVATVTGFAVYAVSQHPRASVARSMTILPVGWHFPVNYSSNGSGIMLFSISVRGNAAVALTGAWKTTALSSLSLIFVYSNGTTSPPLAGMINHNYTYSGIVNLSLSSHLNGVWELMLDQGQTGPDSFTVTTPFIAHVPADVSISFNVVPKLT